MLHKIIFSIYLVAFILVGCSGGENPTNGDENATLTTVPSEYAGLTNPLGAEASAEGAEVFRINCEPCHGPQGHGDGPAGQALEPRPRNLAQIQMTASDDFLFWRIREGKPGTAMVSWKGILTDEQIWQMVSFIRTLK